MKIQVINPNLVSITLSTKELKQFEILTLGDLKHELKFHCLLKFILARAEQLGTLLEAPFAIAALDVEDGIQMDFCLENPVECMPVRSADKDQRHENHTFVFRDFEDVIRVCHRLSALKAQGGVLFVYEGKYTLHLSTANQTALALLEEYGQCTPVTIHVLKEYGKVLFEDEAVKQIVKVFY